jgi:hypothetical protein
MAYGSVLTDVVQSSTAGTPPQFNDGNGTQTGTLCRAWVNYKGTATRGINASFNVSSVTYNATGDYTVTFTNALTDANYAVSVGDLGANGNPHAMPFISSANLATYKVAGSFRSITNVSSSQADQDSGSLSMAFFR